MQISPFKLERYFAEYEFKVKYLLSPSDCEPLVMSELLDLAEENDRGLWDRLRLAYTESQGHPLLRERISGLYRSVSAQNTLVAAPEELIFIAMQTLLQPGDRVTAVYPAYQSLYEIANSLGCEVLPWRFKAQERGWRLDLEELEKHLEAGARLIVINFPHNPTGYLPTLAELERIIALVDRYGAILFSDEMYRLLEHDPSRRLPPVCDLYDRGISLSGLSKSFALPGLRLGWLASNDDEVIRRCVAYKDYTTICNSAPSEILGIIALGAKETILDRNLSIVRENLQTCERFFASHAERFTWLAPQGGSIAFPRWLGPGTVDDFCQDILERNGVMVVPGSIFDFPGGHFRVGLGRRNLPEVLKQVKDYLEDIQELEN